MKSRNGIEWEKKLFDLLHLIPSEIVRFDVFMRKYLNIFKSIGKNSMSMAQAYRAREWQQKRLVKEPTKIHLSEKKNLPRIH